MNILIKLSLPVGLTIAPLIAVNGHEANRLLCGLRVSLRKYRTS